MEWTWRSFGADGEPQNDNGGAARALKDQSSREEDRTCKNGMWGTRV